MSVGNAMVDVVAPVPHLPGRGGDVLAGGGRLVVGGGGFRALVAAVAAGATAVYGGRVGTGPFGDLVRSALASLGIAAPLPAVAESDTGFVVALLEPDGERTFVTVPGAESGPPDLAGLRIEAGDLLHVHGYGLVDRTRAATLVDHVVGLADAVLVLLDPGPFGAGAEPAVLERLMTRVDWWSGNGAEATAAAGVADPEVAAHRLAGRARRGAVVRLGDRGCLVAVGAAAPVRLAATRVRALDTIGAGDTHVGTFLAALAGGASPVAAAAQANEAAARFVSAPTH